MELSTLVGKTLKRVAWNSESVFLYCEDKTYILHAVGDCCRSSVEES